MSDDSDIVEWIILIVGLITAAIIIHAIYSSVMIPGPHTLIKETYGEGSDIQYMQTIDNGKVYCITDTDIINNTIQETERLVVVFNPKSYNSSLQELTGCFETKYEVCGTGTHTCEVLS